MDEVRAVPIRAVAAAIVFGSATLYAVRESVDLFAPLLVSVLLAYALAPIVTAFVRCRLPRPLAVLAVYVMIAVLSVGVARIARRQFVRLVDQLPDTVTAISRALPDHNSTTAAAPSPVDRLQKAARELQAAVDDTTAKPPADAHVPRVASVPRRFSLREHLLNAWALVLATSARLVIVVVLTFVLLIAGDRAKIKIVTAGGHSFEQRKITADVVRAIDHQIERYFIARILISAIVAAATALGLWLLGMDEALALGLVAGVLNVVPFVGPAIGIVICAAAAFMQFHSGTMAAAALGVSGLVAALEGNLITPWLTSRAAELNTVAVFVSVMFWGWMWDVWGLALAIPIMVAVKAAADHIDALQPLGELLGR